MRRAFALALVAAASWGCKKHKDQEPVRYQGTLTVAYGDCGGHSSVFEVGPRPMHSDEGGAGTEGGGGLGGLIAEPRGEKFAPLFGDAFAEDPGGFGFGVIGGADTGTESGWAQIGTIGSGQIGNRTSPIDHRYPSNVGIIGGLHGTGSDQPTIRMGKAEVKGDLDKNIVRRFVRQQFHRLRFCYQTRLEKRPKLAGTADIEWIISPEGRVMRVTVKGLGDRELETCIERTIKAITFPKPKGGGLVQVSYALEFRPPRRPPQKPAQNPERKPEPSIEATFHKPGPIDSPDNDHPPAAEQAEPYQAGTSNPLARSDSSIEQCLRRFHRNGAAVHGHLAVEMEVDSKGLVVSAQARGSRDAALLACVTDEAKALTFRPSERPSRIYRCPLAFSDGDAAHLPGLDIAGEAITYAGTELVATSEVQAPSDSLMVSKIEGAVESRRQAARQKAEEAWVVGTGPLALRAAGKVPVRVVMRALYSATAGGAHVVLAAKGESGWRLLRNVPIPSPPVPWGTGASWAPAGAASVVGALVGPRLALLVGETALWAGSTSGERKELADGPGGGRDQAGLKSVLERWRSHLGDDGSRRIEIAADDSVPYEDLVLVIDAANQAGFTDWTLVTPSSLSVQFR